MISPLAYVSPKAQIGKNVTIDAFAYVDDNVIIGDNCHIFPSAVIGAVPQDLKYKGEETWTIIGDNCVLREFVTVHRGTASKGKTVIGNNNLIMAYCHVAHDCILHNNIIMSNATQLAGEYVIAAREPIAYCGINSVGLNRRGFTPEQIHTIQEAYRLIYQGGMIVSQALDTIEATMPQTPERDAILHFIRNSERGIVRN